MSYYLLPDRVGKLRCEKKYLCLVGKYLCLVGKYLCLVGKYLCLVGKYPWLVGKYPWLVDGRTLNPTLLKAARLTPSKGVR
jgi:hypothetical protein